MGRSSSISSCARPILPIALLLTILVLHESSSLANGAAAPAPAPLKGSSLVKKTCKTAFEDNDEECINELSSDPRSKNVTDDRELVVIAANVTRVKVTETVSAIKELMYNLKNCLKYYREMEDNLRMSVKAIKAGGDLSNVSSAMSRITNAPDDCDIILFESTYEKNPLQDENIRTKSLANLFSKLFEVKFDPKPPVPFEPVVDWRTLDWGALPPRPSRPDDYDDYLSDDDGLLGPSPMPPPVTGRKGNPGR